MASPALQSQTPRELLERALKLKRRRQWEALAAMADVLPPDLEGPWVALADEIAFALGLQKETARAVALMEAVYAVEPTHRRASSLAYLHYDALLDEQARRRKRTVEDREALRRGFTRWIAEALGHFPDSIKDLYRLGIFEAQVENAHDAPALRAFEAAIDAYHALPPERRAGRGDLLKYYARALYAGARSALRLRKTALARKLSFACIRVDGETDHVDPVHKYHLAARVCLADGELDAAERALRIALDAKGPPKREYLFGLLAEVYARRGDLEAAAGWITEHVPAHRRSPALWRQLGDLKRDAGDPDGALAAYETSLQRDRMGRHLTLDRIGELHRAAGRLKKAERAYRDAAEFRRRRYLGEDLAALEGLLAVAEARGREEEAEALRAHLAEVRPDREGRAS